MTGAQAMIGRARMSKFLHGPLAVIVGFYLALGIAFAVTVPAWQVPDEPAHYNYIRQIAQQGQIPVLMPGDYDGAFNMQRIAPPHAQLSEADRAQLEAVQYEDHQPPLYYLLAAPIFALTNGSLLALRLFSVLLGALGIGLTWLALREVFPERPGVVAFATALVALLPQHVFMLAGVNNDALAEALLALVVWLTLRLIVRGRAPTAGEAGALAVTLGLCFLTKTTAYYMLPVAGLAVLALARRGRVWVFHVGLFAALAALIGLPWWARNLALYGGTDVMGLTRHDLVVVGQTTTAEWIAVHGWLSTDPESYLVRGARFTFQSWWGMFGWLSVALPGWLYAALLAFSVLSLALFVAYAIRAARKLSNGQKQALLALAGLTVVTILGFVWYNTKYVQHQGRYLFPALIPAALAVSLGWHQVLARLPALADRAWLLFTGLMVVLDGYALLRVIAPALR